MENSRNGILAISADLCSQIAKSALMAVPPIRRWRIRRPRTSFYIGDTDAYLENNAFPGLNLLIEHTGEIQGSSICEIGAGDFLTSGLSMLAAGARSYTVIDRFPGDYSGSTAKAMYRKVADNWARYFPDRPWDNSLDPNVFPECCPDRVTLLPQPIEDAEVSEKFDIVCSFQVGEHVSNIRAFAEMHNRLLKAGGVAVHRVDFGPHDVWSHYADPTTFLRFPESIWKLSGSNRGIPNRRRHHEFVDAFQSAGLQAEVLYTEAFDEATIDFQRLNSRFRSMPAESLLVKTAIYRLRTV
ncbi:MAG: methyltransferase domain-containing protein [Pyrinomonadaceae bacterium]